MDFSILTGDFESFYTTEYSLQKMTTAEYIAHPLFECIGMAARMDRITLPLAAPSNPRAFVPKAKWIEGPDLPSLFSRIDWPTTAFMSHNVGFDGAILKWRYGITPMLYIDTLGMCRATLPEAKGASLEKALTCIGAPPKGTAIAQAKGWRLADLKHAPAFYDVYKRYAERDNDGCFWLFEHLAHWFAGTAGTGTIHRNEEFVMMDMVARMAISPQFALNMPLLRDYLTTVVTNKQRLLDRLQDSGVLDADNPKGDLMSNEKFALILKDLGIEPPRKISLKTGLESYAFAKTDEEFTDLLEDEDPTVQAVVAARLGFKSTLEETRTQRFIDIGNINWPPVKGGVSAVSAGPPMPFPLKYSGAHTHRFSGGDRLNAQNLGRKSKLREALIAPKDHVIVSADAAQIEARIVSWLAGCAPLVDAFRAGLDNYAILASDVYGYKVDKKTHPGERFVGKTGVLGLGFGMGAPKFVTTCWNQGRNQGLAPELCRITEELAVKTVATYRRKYKEVPAYWKQQDTVINALATRASMTLGVLLIDGPTQSVILPNGMRLYYHNMRQEAGVGFNGQARVQWVFDYGREKKYTFPGKNTENAVQALARIITMNAASRIRRITRFRATPLAGQIHDQLVYVAPKTIAEDLLAVVIEEMSRPLDWFLTLPLAAEGGIGGNLMDIK